MFVRKWNNRIENVSISGIKIKTDGLPQDYDWLVVSRDTKINLGKEIKTVVNDYQSEEIQTISINTSNLPIGIYYCSISTSNTTYIKKMIVINSER